MIKANVICPDCGEVHPEMPEAVKNFLRSIGTKIEKPAEEYEFNFETAGTRVDTNDPELASIVLTYLNKKGEDEIKRVAEEAKPKSKAKAKKTK